MTSITVSLWLAAQIAAPSAGPAPAPPVAATAPPPTSAAPPPAPHGAAPPPAWLAPPIVEEPPRGTWMRVGGGLALGLGSMLGVAALVCYATTDALPRDDTAGRDVLESVSLGLGLAGLVHVAAGIPLVVIGKRQKRRHDAWAQGRTAWRPRVAGGPHGVQVGVMLRF